jgi:methionyl-tRNA formyltransferase
MGTPAFAVPSLERLIESGSAPVAAVTAPDRPRGRGQEVSFTPVKEIALRSGIPLLQPEDLSDPQFIAALRSIAPDLIVVVAFRILPREVFLLPARGAFNLHASLLPKFRGAAPINWALIRGETETGVTTFFLEEKVDTGGIILQRSLPIRPEETAGSLHDRLAVLGAEAVLETVRRIGAGTVRTVAQENARATSAPKIFKETCRIRWDQPGASIANLIRGLSPSPAAFTHYRGQVLKIFRAVPLPPGPLSGSPGEIRVTPAELHVRTADGFLSLEELQLEGRKRLPVAEFLRGTHPAAGELLT